MRHKIDQKIRRINYYLTLLEKYKPDCEERFNADLMFEGALMRSSPAILPTNLLKSPLSEIFWHMTMKKSTILSSAKRH